MLTQAYRWAFLLLSVFCFLGTGYILLEDVIQHHAPVTTDHVLTAMVFFATLGAGHAFFPVLRAGRVIMGLGLGIVCLFGTFTVVSGSAGRTAKATYAKEAEVARRLAEYENVGAMIKTAQAERSKLSSSFAVECGSGQGVRCKGLKTALEEKDDHIRVLQARQDLIPLPPPPNAEIKYLAEVLTIFVGVPQAQIEKALGLIFPLSRAAMMELATLIFFGLAVGHPRRQQQVQEEPKKLVAVDTPLLSVEPDTPTLAVLKAAGRPLTNKELAERLRVSEGYASKLVNALLEEGKIEKKVQGREVFISPVSEA